jgi:hypothetical protein
MLSVSTALELARALSLPVEERIGMTPEEYAKAKRSTRRGRGQRKTRVMNMIRPEPKASASKRTRTPAKAAKG